MTPTGSINLFRSQSALSSQELLLLSRLRFVSVVCTSIVVGIGVVLASLFTYAQLRLNALESEKKSINSQLSLNANKEVLLIALKDRAPILEQIMKNQYNWDGVISTVGQIVQPPNLKLLEVDANNTLTLNVGTHSLDETNEIIARTIELSQQNKLKNAKIDSLEMTSDGQVEATIKFVPVL